MCNNPQWCEVGSTQFSWEISKCMNKQGHAKHFETDENLEYKAEISNGKPLALRHCFGKTLRMGLHQIPLCFSYKKKRCVFKDSQGLESHLRALMETTGMKTTSLKSWESK